MSREALTSTQVREIVGKELSDMPAELSGRVREYLVEPNRSERSWAYGPETFGCWIVLADKNSGTGIALCEQEPQPGRRWILLWIDSLRGYDHLGQDSSWFSSLEDAFNDSFVVNR
jgi:hypothetical protein